MYVALLLLQLEIVCIAAYRRIDIMYVYIHSLVVAMLCDHFLIVSHCIRTISALLALCILLCIISVVNSKWYFSKHKQLLLTDNPNLLPSLAGQECCHPSYDEQNNFKGSIASEARVATSE